MSGPPPDYYNRLGLPASATHDEIKKRYRQLARKFHPDVNPSPEAAQKIKLINEAYHTLGDEERRASYDADRVLRQQAAARTSPPPSQASPQATRRQQPQPRPGYPDAADFNGFGRTPRRAPAEAYRRQQQADRDDRRQTASRRAAGSSAATDRLIAEAQLAFINRKYQEAESLCRTAISIDQNNAVAHEILGDVHLKRGNIDLASTAYTYAVQLNPRNYNVQAKLERLNGRPSNIPGPTVVGHNVPGLSNLMEGVQRESTLLFVNIALLVLGVTTFWLFYSYPGSPIPFLFYFSSNLILALGVLGVVSGCLLAFHGGMRPIRDELMTRELRSDSSLKQISLGALLTLFSLIWFYASALVFISIGYARNRLSSSVLRVYVLAFIESIIIAFCYNPAGAARESPYIIQVMALAGNILFPTMLVGWSIGDTLRLRR